MKKHTLVARLIFTAALGGASAYAQATSPSPTPAACNYSSWNPELYSFYGEKDVIVNKLGKIPVKLSERRVFLQVTQGESNADVKLYERQENGTFTVTAWTKKQNTPLL